MIRNLFKTAIIGFQHRKLFTVINIAGLTIGLTLVGLIGIFVFESFKVDQDQPERLYRVTTTYESETSEAEIPAVGRALIPKITMEIPEVESVIPLYKAPLPVKIERDHYFDEVAFAGEEFLESFNFEILQGDAHNSLRGPNKVVLTESTAHKYFATSDVIGRTVLLGDSIPLTVTGVIADMVRSHMNIDLLISFDTWLSIGGNMDDWFVWDMTCYVLLKPGTDPTLTTLKIAALSMTNNGDQYRQNGYEVSHRLEAVQDIFLKSPLQGFNRASGNLQQLYILIAIGAALLILACINFINLTTALQLERMKEVGVRKTLGAPTGALRLQFLTETGILVLLATVAAYGFILLVLPFARHLTGLDMNFFDLFHAPMLISTIGLIILTMLLAGLYPAILLAGLQPISAIKKTSLHAHKGIQVRQGLVVFQFTTTLILMACTYICILQIRHMDSQDMGFQKEQVVVIDLSKTPFREFTSNYDGVKHELQQITGIEIVSGSAGLPGQSGWSGQIVKPEGFSQEKSFTMEVIPSDVDYTKALQIPIVAGRAPRSDIPTDMSEGVLLNETACRLIGWTPEEAIGKRLHTSGMENGVVIGVMADYHQHGLRHAINPIMVFNATYAYNFIALRINSHTSNIQQITQEVKDIWNVRFPGYPFEFFMLEDDFNAQYHQERIMAKIIGVFALMTILVACLGLIGLTTYTIVQKRKEIGIRKVLGASVSGIVAMLSRDFVKLVCLAIVIASPIAWWAMNQWLADFAYRIEIQWWMFSLAGMAAVAIALLTVASQAIRAAVANPVDSLRDE